MKMKNFLMGGMSLALVACVSIGGTLAYFNAQDGAVENTFTFAGGGDGGAITVNLYEEKPDAVADETITGDKDSGWSYSNVVPGQILNKAPQVDVDTSVASYVFVRVTAGNVTVKDLPTTNTDAAQSSTQWTKLTGVEGVENVYYRTVAKSDSEQKLGELFTKVQVPEGNGTETLNPVKIEVAAIQSTGFTNAADAYTTGGVENLFVAAQD